MANLSRTVIAALVRATCFLQIIIRSSGHGFAD